MRMIKRKILFSLFLVSLVLTLFPGLVNSQMDTYDITVSCSEKMRLRGQTVQINTVTNASSFQQTILNPSGNVAYNQTRTSNMSFTVPANAEYGTYKIQSIAGDSKAETWLTVLDITGWTQTTFPYTRTWKNVQYTFYSNGTINAQSTTTNETLNVDLSTLRNLAIQYSLDVTPSYNSMNFRVRFSKNAITIDLTFSFIHSGCKFTINGTLDQPRTFNFELANPQKLRNVFDSLRNGNMVFDWSDLRKVGNAFSYSNGVLTVDVPQTFTLDPEIFSDGFESGDFSAWTGNETSGAVGTVNTDAKHTGTYGFQVVGGASAGDRCQYMKDIAVSEAYIRAYVKHSSVPSSSNQWQGFIALDNINPATVIYNSVTTHWGVRDNIGGWTNHWGSTDKAMSTDWMCIELHVLCSATVGVYEVWVDGTKVMELTGHNTGTALGHANVGMFYTDDPQAADLTIYYDCVIVDSSYIGPEAGGTSTSINPTGTIALTSSLTTTKTLTKSQTETTITESTLTTQKSLYTSTTETIIITSTLSNSKTIISIFTETVNLVSVLEVTKSVTAHITEVLTGTVNILDTLEVTKHLAVTMVELAETVHLTSLLTVTLPEVAITAEDALGFAIVAFTVAIGAFGLVFLYRRKG